MDDRAFNEFIEQLLAEEEVEGAEGEGRRFIRWQISRGSEKDLKDLFMDKIRREATTTFFLRHTFSFWLRNVEDGTDLLYYKNSGGHLGFTTCQKRRLGGKKRRRRPLTTSKDQTPCGFSKDFRMSM